ncbi:MAG: HAD-IC family P-type ATPase, partial [Clostridia bacterium]|nr:HAD-IC family P-type ATPase [Clostridia bacterium]
MDTKVGKIAHLIINTEDSLTPLQEKLAKIGKLLGIGALTICAFIFILGLFKGTPVLEMFMTSVGLAVAAIPEGLPAIVTIILSIGVTKMAKENTIIRKLPAVETLGSSNIICSDKTGTLTQNKMTVVEVTSKYEKLIEYATLCTNVQDIKDNHSSKFSGSATEIAICNYAASHNTNKHKLEAKYPRIEEIPFDSKRKLMTTLHKFGNKYVSITKGAPDILIS